MVAFHWTMQIPESWSMFDEILYHQDLTWPVKIDNQTHICTRQNSVDGGLTKLGYCPKFRLVSCNHFANPSYLACSKYTLNNGRQCIVNDKNEILLNRNVCVSTAFYSHFKKKRGIHIFISYRWRQQLIGAISVWTGLGCGGCNGLSACGFSNPV